MPHPYARTAIPRLHKAFYSSSNPDVIQVFADGERVLNSHGDNPSVLEISTEDKVLLGLTEFAVAYRIRLFGKGNSTVDEFVTGTKSWTMSFDNGDTQKPFAISDSIRPDPSMTTWLFTLYRTV